MSIIWREQMSVGNNLIDKEHKYLIDQINTVEVALNSKENHDIVVEALNHFLEYTKVHFEHEETIQQKLNYPKLEEHKQEHKHIVDKFNEIKQELDKILGSDSPGLEADINDEITDEELNQIVAGNEIEHSVSEDDLAPLVRLMRSWFIDHVIGSDREMKPYLLKKQPDFK